MDNKRSVSFFWSLAADFEPDAGLQHHVELAAGRLARLCERAGSAKNQLLASFQRQAHGRFEAALTLRHRWFLFFCSEQALSPVDAFEAACVKLEETVERLGRFQRKPSTGEPVRPFKRTGAKAPSQPEDLLKEMAADFSHRLRRTVRRRLRTEAIIHPDWPIGEISDGDVVDETIARLLISHPKDIPFGAFWPWALGVCEDVLDECLEELQRIAETTVSLEESLAEEDGIDDGYDIEHPWHILQRVLEPSEAELGDATPDERDRAPSTVAEYHDFVRCLHETMAGWPRKERQVAEYYCFEGMTPQEIGRLQKRPQESVVRTLKHILPRLREAMDETRTAPSPRSGSRPGPA